MDSGIQTAAQIDGPVGQPAFERAEARESRFVRPALAIGLILILGLALWRLADVLLLVFGAVLLSVALRGLARRLQQALYVPMGVSLAVVVAALIAIVGLTLWLFGSQIASQYDEIVAKAPVAIDQILERVRSHSLGRYLVQGAEGVGISSATGAVATAAAKLVASIAQGLAYAAFAIFGGVYLAADPKRYRSGILRLVPPARRGRYGQLLNSSGAILEKWLLGQLVVMATVGTLSGIGLWALGIDAAFALALTGGVLCFIPFVGAFLAAVPAVLMAFIQSPIDAAYTALLFMGVHFVEGNFITPLVQDEAVSLPPVISVFSTLIFTILFGPFAVIVAVPITIIALMMVEMLYVEDALGEAPLMDDRTPAERIEQELRL
jgi:predicted PurR-regulated permease PerM